MIRLECDRIDCGEELEVAAYGGRAAGGDQLIGACVGEDEEAAGWGCDTNGAVLCPEHFGAISA